MLLKRFVNVEKNEQSALIWSFAYFFCILSSYYVLRPLRDEMGIQAGVERMQWLFTGTFLAMLIAVPAYGWLVGRFPRRRMLPLVYGFFVANLLIFYAILKSNVAVNLVAAAFFIWVSVFNLFVVSVFWSFMVDLFNNEQAKRLFGFIAAGGSVGAIAGPALTAALAPLLGPINLLLVSALLLVLAIGCIHSLTYWARTTSLDAVASGDVAITGSALSGIALIVRSKFLIGICLYVLLYTTSSTFLYFEQARIVRDAIPTSAERTQLFAMIDLAVNTLTLVSQLFVTSRIVTRFGLAIALAIVPALTVIGFVFLAIAPTVAVLASFQILRRAGDFAISRPAREMLFAAVNREAKYRAKNVIDTVVYRSGDAASGWLVAGLRALAANASVVAWVAAPLSALWLITGYALGRRQDALPQSNDAASPKPLQLLENRE
jgi:ATP:ADP antiporter, AAA family